MPISTGPNIVGKNNLIFALDAADKKNSFLPFSTFLNMSSWVAGNGGIGPYSQNGANDENARVLGVDPWGNAALVWESRPNSSGEADGGWNTSWYSIDRTKLYRFSVWVKRTSSTSGGYSYLGLYGTGGTWGVERLDGGGNEGNPYWECNGAGAYTQNQWYLMVGHCYPAGTTGVPGNKHPDTGRYTVNGRDGDLNYCNIGGDVRWLSNTTEGLHRTYHYYCSDNTTRLQWHDPRFEVCDGTEPTIQDLLKGPAVYNRSLTSTTKGLLNNGVMWSRNNQGTFTFDGSDDCIDLDTTSLISGTNPFTIESVTNLTAGSYGAILGNYGPGYGTGLWWATAGLYIQGSVYYDNYSSANQGWHHLVATRDELGNVKLYRDGVLSKTGTLTASVPTNIAWRIGADVVNAGEALAGNIPVVKVYNTVLSADQIKQNYQQYKSRFNLN